MAPSDPAADRLESESDSADKNFTSPSLQQRQELCNNLNKLREDTILCDVKLVTRIGKKEDEITNLRGQNSHNDPKKNTIAVSCHRLVLMSASPVLRRALTDRKVVSLDVSPIEPEALKLVVDFMYTGVCEINEHSARALLDISIEWCIPALTDMCTSHFRFLLSEENVVAFFEFLPENSGSELYHLSRNFIRGHFTNFVRKSEAFKQMSINKLCDVIKDDELNVASEDTVFQAVVSWARDHPKEDTTPLLNLVRFEFLSTSFICDEVAKHPLTQREDIQKKVLDATIVILKRSQNESSRPSMLTTGKKKHTSRHWSGKNDSSSEMASQRPKIVCLIGDDICQLQSGTWSPIMPIPMWMDKWGGTAVPYSSGFIIPRTSNTFTGWQIYLIDLTKKWHICLPVFPIIINSAGIIWKDDYLYVIGGSVPEGFGFVKTNKVFHLKIDGYKNRWMELPSLPAPVTQPVVLAVDEKIYVIGGIDVDKQPARGVYTYSIKTKTWKSHQKVCFITIRLVRQG